MAKVKVARLRSTQKAPKRDLRAVVVEVERVVSRALSEISVVQTVLLAKKRESDDLEPARSSASPMSSVKPRAT